MIGARPVVWINQRDGERCGGCPAEIQKGTLIVIRRDSGVRCLACAGLIDLEYLPAGDTALTRRALVLSSRAAIVVKFSRARKRNERQGVLVESQALAAAREACKTDAARRQAERGPRQAPPERREQDYLTRFVARILELFPGCPREEAGPIAQRACEKYSGRVGRSGAAKALDKEAVTLAVRAHVRHCHTRYDNLLAEGFEPVDARPLIAGEIEEHLAGWSRGMRRSSSKRVSPVHRPSR